MVDDIVGQGYRRTGLATVDLAAVGGVAVVQIDLNGRIGSRSDGDQLYLIGRTDVGAEITAVMRRIVARKRRRQRIARIGLF